MTLVLRLNELEADYPAWAQALSTHYVRTPPVDQPGGYGIGVDEFARFIADHFCDRVTIVRGETEGSEIWTFESDEDLTMLILKAV
jgi:hypothetical protein